VTERFFAEVPASDIWPKKRARFLFRERRERTRTDDKQLTASQGYGVISQDRYQLLSGNKVTAALAGTETFLHVEVDDFVISLRTFEGGIERSYEQGCISPAYTVMIPSCEVEPSFFQYALKSQAFISTLQTTVTGIRDGKSVRFQNFANLLLPVPDLYTQKTIAAFLDGETARIDQLIEKKERVLSLFRERRLSAIAKATDKTGPLAKLGHHVTILPGYAFSSETFSSDTDDMRLLRGINVTPGTIRWEDTVFWPRTKLSDVQRFLLKVGDVVLGMDRPWVSSGIRIAEIASADTPSLLLQRVCRISPRHTLDKGYMKLLLASPRFLAHFEPILTGVSVPHISGDQVAAFRFPLIPITEQKAAATECDQAFAKIGRLEEKVLRSVDCLREFRSTLINAAVTGQIDPASWGKRNDTDRRAEAYQEAGA
jgi:type I restriction enzyme S subunit